MSNKEEILKKLLKNLLEERLKRLEKRELEEKKDLKLAKDAYNKQGILLKKLCSVKIEPEKNLKRNNTHEKFLRNRDKTPNKLIKNYSFIDKNKSLKISKTPNIIMRKKKIEIKEKNENLRKAKTPLKTTKKLYKTNNIKIQSYMMETPSNKNKNKNLENKSNIKRALTPEIKNKNKIINKKKKIKNIAISELIYNKIY